MARVLVGQMLAEEDMSQMTIAMSAADLGPLAIRIHDPLHGAREISIKGRPTATSIKFRLGRIERGIATPAEIGARSEESIILSRKRRLGPATSQYLFLLSVQCIPGHIRQYTVERLGRIWYNGTTFMEEHPFIRPRICVIDDDADLREIYLLNLNRENFDAVLAQDGEEGLRIIREQVPDAIILDLQMPKKNGFEVLEEISMDVKLRSIPVVILSNADDQESFKKVGQFETHFYLVKALTTPQKVVKILREVIK